MEFDLDSFRGKVDRNRQKKSVLSRGNVPVPSEPGKDGKKGPKVITKRVINQIGFAVSICVPQWISREQRPIRPSGTATRLQAGAPILRKSLVRMGVWRDQNETVTGLVRRDRPGRLIIVGNSKIVPLFASSSLRRSPPLLSAVPLAKTPATGWLTPYAVSKAARLRRSTLAHPGPARRWPASEIKFNPLRESNLLQIQCVRTADV
ncbi:MAG: hypothetical protein CM1200mP29_00860 [Verrucomicrobiota bacterium]|nr:MAG: hypothetical protein CM1200mP29_00860 [Verrucomicrobiota bacterium]